MGVVCIDPDPDSGSFEDSVSFTGCFRCRRCDAIGPWKFPWKTEAILLGHATACSFGDAEGPAFAGRMQLFDGTRARTGEEAVEHLRGLIAKDPEDAFIWSRLGNTYRAADRNEQAADAYRRALELDETDVESAHSLAQILGEDGASEEECAEFFHAVLEHAWKKKDSIHSELLRRCVRSALEELFELHEATDGKIDVFPRPALDPSARSSKTAVLEVRTFDLSSDAEWEDFVSQVLREPSYDRHEPTSRRRFRRRTDTGLSSTRNGPCPCGSGRKFKNCCDRR